MGVQKPMIDCGPFQDIIEVGWKIVPSLALVRMVYVHPDVIDEFGADDEGGIGAGLLINLNVVSDLPGGIIRFGRADKTFNAIPFGDTVSQATVSAPGSFSIWVDMKAVRQAFANVPPVEDPENPGEFLDPAVTEEVVIDIFGVAGFVERDFAVPVAIEVTVYGGPIAAPVETFLPPAFNDFSIVNPGGRKTGRADTTLRKANGGTRYDALAKGEYVIRLVLGTEEASIKFIEEIT